MNSNDATTADPIVRRKLADAVQDRLMALLTGGELQPGDAMPSERELMTRFGVGRPAIREAMQTLANMGLITISHGERARVRQLTAESVVRQVDAVAHLLLSSAPDALEQLKDARRFFERGMVREAAVKASEADLADLRRLLVLQRSVLGEERQFMASDIRFHRRIAAISGNSIFEAVAAAMLGWLQLYHPPLLLWVGKETLTLTEHAEIIGCIERRDPDAAEEAMIRHLDRSRGLYVHPRPA